LRFQNRADRRTIGIGFEILQIRYQQNHLEQQIETGFGTGRNGHHHHIAAPVLRQQIAVGQLLLDALRLSIRLVDLVDRDDDRHFRGFGVIDGFERLRHHAVVGRHHQHHDIGDFRAARAHARERFVAGSIDKHDLAAVLLDVIRADVLRDPAGFALGHIGRADGVQQRCLSVIDVAHDGDHGRPRLTRSSSHLEPRSPACFLFVADLVGGSAEIARQVFGQLYVQRLVDGGEDFLFHQLLDHQIGGKFLDAELFAKAP
jgi:hypothetical protein